MDGRDRLACHIYPLDASATESSSVFPIHIQKADLKPCINLHAYAFQSGLMMAAATTMEMMLTMESLQLVNDTSVWIPVRLMIPLHSFYLSILFRTHFGSNRLLATDSAAGVACQVFDYEIETQTNHKCIWLISNGA